MSKILTIVISEVIGAIFFVIMIIIVTQFQEIPYFAIKPALLVFIWIVYSIGTPILIMNDLIKTD